MLTLDSSQCRHISCSNFVLLASNSCLSTVLTCWQIMSFFLYHATRVLASSLAFSVLSFSAPPGLEHLCCCLSPTPRCLQSSRSSHESHLTTLGWSLPPFSRRFCSLLLMFFVAILRLVFGSVELLDSSFSSPSTSIPDSSATELRCVGVSATARLLSIGELPLLATAVAAFIAHLFSGSARLANSPAALPTSSLLLTFFSTSFAIASFNTAILRSKRSDLSGVDFRQFSILTRQGLEWACARFPDLIAFVSPACPRSAFHQQLSTGTPITLLIASLSHLSCCSPHLTSRALNTLSAVSTKHSATVDSHGTRSVQQF